MKLDYDYYFEPKKIIRDLAHGYINLTEFELSIIDTDSFQRLKDIRQLTCQEVYPSAKHTRFEHSLGVLELTRKAIKHLNENKFLPGASTDKSKRNKPIIDKTLQLNATVAALLHDVGHCPFSHLGEKEFNKADVKEELIKGLRAFNKVYKSIPGKISNTFIQSYEDRDLNESGGVHEMISCLVILERFDSVLLETDIPTRNKYKETKNIYIDFELIIRCILRVRYEIKSDNSEQAAKHNAIIHLINDKIFDMDKLDYIMRDTVFTGLNVGTLDTKRLFRNMYFENNKTYDLVFTSKAVPALQNFIEARDMLYMYVYNHHAAVLADFMNSYIIRRLAGNSEKYKHLLNILCKKLSNSTSVSSPILASVAMDYVLNNDFIYGIGIVPREYLFSVSSILHENHSDSEWISLLNIIYTRFDRGLEVEKDAEDAVLYTFYDAGCTYLDITEPNVIHSYTDVKNECQEILMQEEGQVLMQRVFLTHKIISDYKNRHFLKPWWKTLSEFTTFLDRNYQDVLVNGTPHEDIRQKICEMITYGAGKISADDLRGQIATLVIRIVNALKAKKIAPLEKMTDGDFFIVERSTRFNEIENIRKLRIASGLTTFEKSQDASTYYNLQSLNDVLPQKNYRSIYNKESFYVYSRPLPAFKYNQSEKGTHYHCIEKIFVFVTIKFLELHDTQINRYFGQSSSKDARTRFFNLCIKEFIENYKPSTIPPKNSLCRRIINPVKNSCTLKEQ